MRFHIKRLFIWFGKDDVPAKRVIKFDNNKVNVITGDSSTGKSNILAIIDYCLLTDSPKIVFPVINEFAEWYGLEFEADGKVMHIVRKKPTEETSASELVMGDGEIADEYYPSTNNIHINDARKQLNYIFGLRQSAQRNIGIKDEDGNELTLSYRSFLIYNAITEGIMSSPYIFTDTNFFNSRITKSHKGQRYLFEELLGVDNVKIRELAEKIDQLEGKRYEHQRLEKKISKKSGSYRDKLNYLLSLCRDNGVAGPWEDGNLTDDDIINHLEDLVARLAPKVHCNDNEELNNLMTELNQKAMLLDNMKRAKKEYERFLEQLDVTVDKLKPIEYLKDRLESMGISEWTSYILDSFEVSLKKLQSADVKRNEDVITSKAIEDLEREVDELRNRVLSQEHTRELSIEKNNNLFYVIGVLKAELPSLSDLRSKIPVLADPFTPQDEIALNAYTEEKKTIEGEALKAYQSINDVFNEVYSTFNYMEYYQDCKPKYNKEDRRLELNNGRSIINYTNVGSQSNYMFLHLCFFLGIHKYLAMKPNAHIGQFLFVDQPSIPYYNGGNEVKTTDEAKLKDAFNAINMFMNFVVKELGAEFQIIMIEHAPPSYWDGLDYFNTTEQFVEGKALIPREIKEKYSI